MDPYSMRSREKWQEILEELCRELGMPAAIMDKKNVVLQVSGERNPLCFEIRANEESLVFICSQTQIFMAQEARKTRKPVIDVCEAGMLKYVIPLFFKGEYIGSLTGCGACIPKEEIQTFVIEKSSKMGEEKISRLARSVHEVEQAKVVDVVNRFSQETQRDMI